MLKKKSLEVKLIDVSLFHARLSKLPSCLLVCSIAVLVDVPLITAVALWKSPLMLLRGWKRLLEDLIGREGPFLEAVCVPFAGLAILLWPLAVIGAVLGAFVSSFFLALYSGVIVHQVCHYLPFLLILLCFSLSFEKERAKFPGRLALPGTCIRHISGFNV